MFFGISLCFVLDGKIVSVIYWNKVAMPFELFTFVGPPGFLPMLPLLCDNWLLLEHKTVEQTNVPQAL